MIVAVDVKSSKCLRMNALHGCDESTERYVRRISVAGEAQVAPALIFDFANVKQRRNVIRFDEASLKCGRRRMLIAEQALQPRGFS